jgi:hypothetical protein
MTTKQGYTVNQWQQMYNQDLPFLQNAVVSITPFSGLSANALAHLRNEWLSWDNEVVRVNIPAEAECNSYRLATGKKSSHLPMLSERDKPCSYCRMEGSAGRFENRWVGTDGSTPEPYTTILHRDLATPAVEALDTVFRVHNRPEFAASPGSILSAAQSVPGEQSDDNTFSYSKFLRTGPVLLAEYGLSANEISEVSVYTQKRISEIVMATPGTNFEHLSTLSLLRTVSKMEPVTIAELSKRLELTESNVYERLIRLQEEEQVAVQNNHSGRPAATWKTTNHWHKPIPCDDCDFRSHSIGGIRSHRGHSH